MPKKDAAPIVWIAETAPTPLGPLWVAASEQGCWAVEYGVPRQDFIRLIQKRGQVEPVYSVERLAPIIQQFVDYLEGKRGAFDLSVDWRGMTEFQIKVRQAVMAIPYGETASYGDIAAQVGAPRAARAVGRVQATNPLPLLIPCHRVLGADGNLHGYGGPGGLQTKAWLLDLEKQNRERFS